MAMNTYYDPPPPDIADDLRIMTKTVECLIRCRECLRHDMGRISKFLEDGTTVSHDTPLRAEEAKMLERSMRLAMQQTELTRQKVTSDLEGLLGVPTGVKTIRNIAQAIMGAHMVADHATDILEGDHSAKILERERRTETAAESDA